MATAGDGQPPSKEHLVQRGGCLHKLVVPSEKGDMQLGPVLDDSEGPLSSSIASSLRVYDFTKDLGMVLKLPCFALYSYHSERDEKDYKQDFAGWVGYLGARQKAAMVVLDKHGMVGYLYPQKRVATIDGRPGVLCFYKGGEGTGREGKAAVASPTASTASSKKRGRESMTENGDGGKDGSSAKRPNATRFRYIPPDPHQVVSEPSPIPYDPDQVARGSGSLTSAMLPHPSQFPISTNARFAYVPPTPPPGVDPPSGYFDPPSRPSTDWVATDYDEMLPPEVVEAVMAPIEEAAANCGGGNNIRSVGPPMGDGHRGGGGGDRRHKGSEVAKGDDQRAAAAFYDNLDRNKGNRKETFIMHLRKLNNWVKASLINETKPASKESREVEILDLACGKGGDFQKYEALAKNYRVDRYVGIDIARASLVDAIGRYSQSASTRRALGASATLACADLGSTDLIHDEIEVWRASENEWNREQLLDETDAFDLISMQFALHYMFETEDRASAFLAVVARHLKPGGTFIATTVDARVVVELLSAKAVKDEETGNLVASITDEQRRVLLKIKVSQDTFDQIFRSSLDEPSPEAGLRYWFTLNEGGDGDGKEAVDAPEWLIPLDYLVRLAKAVGLELEYAQNFHDFVDERRHEQDDRKKGTMGMNRWVNYKGSISEAEWELARIYIALRFRKKR